MTAEARAVLQRILKAIDASEQAGPMQLTELKLLVLAAQHPGIAKRALAETAQLRGGTFAAQMSHLSDRRLITTSKDEIVSLSDEGLKLIEAVTSACRTAA